MVPARRKHGDPIGEVKIADACATGNGFGHSQVEPLNWYRKAAAWGNAYAQMRGEPFLNGDGVERDPQEAMRLFRQSADGGNARPQSYVRAI